MASVNFHTNTTTQRNAAGMDVWVFDPPRLDLGLFNLWLRGVTGGYLISLTFHSPRHDQELVFGFARHSEEEACLEIKDFKREQRELFLKEAVDQYRCFQLLQAYLQDPSDLETQPVFAIPPDQQVEIIAQ